jgi:hypothetical protein
LTIVSEALMANPEQPGLDRVESCADKLRLIANLKKIVGLEIPNDLVSLESVHGFLAKHRIIETIVEAILLNATERNPGSPEDDQSYPRYVLAKRHFMAVIERRPYGSHTGLTLCVCGVKEDPDYDQLEAAGHKVGRDDYELPASCHPEITRYWLVIPITDEARVDTRESSSTDWSARQTKTGTKEETLYSYDLNSPLHESSDMQGFVGVLQEAAAGLVSVL